MAHIIHTENLSRRFGDIIAVNNVSLEVEEGEIFGLLGPNGAGKTTFIKMLTTLLRPTSGNATVCGFSILTQRERVRENIGLVFQEPSLDIELTARENLDFHARMYGMEKNLREERISRVLNLVDLEDRADDIVKTFSGGMQRRLEIARGIMHHPKVLFLDEPTLGLDAQTRRKIWDYIISMNREEGVTIILTTHYMEEADHLCDRVAIIDNGNIRAVDTPERLKDRIGGEVLYLELGNGVEEYLEKLKLAGFGKTFTRDGGIYIHTHEIERKIPDILKLAFDSGYEVKEIRIRKPTLEDVFIKLTGYRELSGSRKDRIVRIITSRRLK